MACRISALLLMFCFEDAQRVGIGDHERGDVLGDDALERRHIQHAAFVGADVLDRVAGDGGGGGIGAVRGIGNQDLLARIAALFEQRANQQDAGQLAVRAGRGLQRDGVHAGDLGQRGFQTRHDFHARPAPALRADRDAPRPGLRVRATSSLTRGLYFMVQEPSGYMPWSMA